MIDNDTRCAHRELEDRLRPFVARRVPRSDVDDVLQDVFLRAQRALPDLRDEERFGAWMYRVARSAIAESHRQRSRHPVLEAEAPELPMATEGSDPTPLETEVAGYLVPLISRLPSPYREALTLTDAALGVAMEPSSLVIHVDDDYSNPRLARHYRASIRSTSLATAPVSVTWPRSTTMWMGGFAIVAALQKFGCP